MFQVTLLLLQFISGTRLGPSVKSYRRAMVNSSRFQRKREPITTLVYIQLVFLHHLEWSCTRLPFQRTMILPIALFCPDHKSPQTEPALVPRSLQKILINYRFSRPRQLFGTAGSLPRME